MADKLTLYAVVQHDDPTIMNDIVQRAVEAFNKRLADYFEENIRGLLHSKHRGGTLVGAFATLFGKEAVEREMDRDEAIEKIARALEFMLIDWMELSLQRFIDAAYDSAEQEADT
jgi:hypothetical protein